LTTREIQVHIKNHFELFLPFFDNLICVCKRKQYIAAAGYKSYVTVSVFNTTDADFNGVKGDFPSTASETALLTSLGIQSFAIDASWTVADATTVSDALLRLPKPVYVHCFVGYSASLFTLLHLTRAGALSADNLFAAGLALGYDYQSNSYAVPLINEFTGLNASVVPASIESTLANGEQSYKTFYWPHRLSSDYWFNMGQPLGALVSVAASQGYRTVLSFRADGESTTRLPSEPSTGPVINDEFSDAQGRYSVAAEQAAWEAAGVKFVNLPVSGANAWSPSTFEQYRSTMQVWAICLYCICFVCANF
jgi:protein tyrosine phosphatase (PTP) superfamily phosphohydrolase (DUF442 family)